MKHSINVQLHPKAFFAEIGSEFSEAVERPTSPPRPRRRRSRRRPSAHEDYTAESSLRYDNHNLEVKCKRQKHTIHCLRDELVLLKHSAAVNQRQPRYRQGMLVALARNRGHTSAKSAGQWAALIQGANGMHGTTVARWERAAGNCLLAKF